MSAAILFATLTLIAIYIVRCDEQDHFELAVKRLHEIGLARFVYAFSESAGNHIKLKLEVFSLGSDRDSVNAHNQD